MSPPPVPREPPQAARSLNLSMHGLSAHQAFLALECFIYAMTSRHLNYLNGEELSCPKFSVSVSYQDSEVEQCYP